MKYIFLAASWIFGIFSLLIAIVSLTENLYAALSFLCISLLLIPPIRNFFFSITKVRLSVGARTVAIIILFASFGYFTGEEQRNRDLEIAAAEAEQLAREIAAARQEDIEFFNQNSIQIIENIQTALDNDDFDHALSLSSRYLPSENQDLLTLHNEINSQIAITEAKEKAEREEQERVEGTLRILAQLEDVPESQFQTNRDLYQQLVSYNPEVERYRERLNFFSSKLAEQQKEEQAELEKQQLERTARLALFGEPPTPSAWDGSYRIVTSYLRSVANDPDSIEIDACTKVFHTEGGWLVGCDYRGRNGFGGMIRQSNWFTIIHNTVIEMHESSAFTI
jgi:hypothetical protein